MKRGIAGIIAAAIFVSGCSGTVSFPDPVKNDYYKEKITRDKEKCERDGRAHLRYNANPPNIFQTIMSGVLLGPLGLAISLKLRSDYGRAADAANKKYTNCMASRGYTFGEQNTGEIKPSDSTPSL